MKSRSQHRLAILGTRGIPAAYGGFETFAEEIAIRLVAAGVDVTVYCEENDLERKSSYKGVRLRYIPARLCGPLTTVLFDLRCLWNARKDFDVVYMLGYGAAQFCFIPRLFGSKVWINADGIEWKRAKWSLFARLYFKAMEFFSTITSNCIIADAEGIREHLQRRHWRIPSCSVIPYGAPLLDNVPPSELIIEWGLNPDAYYLVVCRLEPENHVLEIIQGFLASSSSRPLVIIGNIRSGTEYVERLLSLASDRLIFIGTVFDKARLQALRYHSFAYFHGHSVGGTNPSLLEAMGCGNIVIAHDNVFNREVLGAGGCYFSSPLEIPALVEEAENAEFDAREQARTYLRERIRTIYSWDLVAESYLHLLETSVHIANSK